VSSLNGSARRWINKLPKGSIKTPEDIEQAFKKDWCEKESMDSLYSQYIDICKASSKGIRDFNYRFNLLLKKIGPSFLEEAFLQHYLNSLEGVLQFTLKDRSPSTLEEARDFSFHIEKNLEFEDYIHQVNLSCNNDPWESSDEDITETEPKFPEILEVKLMPPKRKWNISFSNINNVLNVSRQHEPSKDLGMATHKIPNFEDSLFVLNTPMLKNQDMNETNRSEEPRVHNRNNLDTSMWHPSTPPLFTLGIDLGYGRGGSPHLTTWQPIPHTWCTLLEHLVCPPPFGIWILCYIYKHSLPLFVSWNLGRIAYCITLIVILFSYWNKRRLWRSNWWIVQMCGCL
jgi:hypothetical protein